jgi:hypothetical protein
LPLASSSSYPLGYDLAISYEAETPSLSRKAAKLTFRDFYVVAIAYMANLNNFGLKLSRQFKSVGARQSHPALRLLCPFENGISQILPFTHCVSPQGSIWLCTARYIAVPKLERTTSIESI